VETPAGSVDAHGGGWPSFPRSAAGVGGADAGRSLAAVRADHGAEDEDAGAVHLGCRDKDAQTQEHADVLNRLNDVLRAAGVAVVYGTGRPACDLAFRTSRGLTIVEAKSLPKGSDEHQMRVGLGQILQYRAEVAEHVKGRIRPVLAVARAPERLGTWRAACGAAGAELLVVGAAARGLRKALVG
jgi:hypothetical protein